MKRFKCLSLVFAVLLMLMVGCKPTSLDISLYTTDIDVANNNEIVMIPVSAVFSMMGDDEEGLLKKCSEVVKKYLPKDSEVNTAEGTYGKQLVVETKIPFGNRSALNAYGEKNKFLVYLLLMDKKDKKHERIILKKSSDIKVLNAELSQINMMLDFDLPSKKTRFRIISDSKEEVKVMGQSTWVSKKPYLFFQESLNKREEVELLFKGGDDSVYSELSPIFFIMN